MRCAVDAPALRDGGEAAGGMVLVAGDGQRVDVGYASGEWGEEGIHFLVGEHADDEVQFASSEAICGEEGADGFSGSGVVAAVEPGFAFGRERG